MSRVVPVFRRLLSHCLLYAMRGVARTPWEVQCAFGGAAGWLMYRFMRRRRRIAERNVALCFPRLDEPARSSIVRRHFRSLGLGIVEVALAWWGRDGQIAAWSRIVGSEHLEAALSHGRGVILFGGHFTTFEIGGRILASRFEVGATYRPHNDPWWDSMLRTERLRYLSALVAHKDARAMVRYLGRNRILWYAPDQRRFTEAQMWVPKKNGKSTLAAAVALYLLCADGERSPEIYIAAAKMDQARIVAEIAHAMARRSRGLRGAFGLGLTGNSSARAPHIKCARNDGILRPLARDQSGTQDGLDVSGAVVDEIHPNSAPTHQACHGASIRLPACPRPLTSGKRSMKRIARSASAASNRQPFGGAARSRRCRATASLTGSQCAAGFRSTAAAQPRPAANDVIAGNRRTRRRCPRAAWRPRRG